jgi:SAM-dependent methyltransferase
MSDLIFENKRLVEIYDIFNGHRSDLDYYATIAKELKAISVLDIGCGTGSFACLLSAKKIKVIGVDPAQESLNIARKKPYADQVCWILGDTSCLPSLTVDLAVMTGNVAQVFLTEECWGSNLIAIRKALREGGHIVFEVRDPAKQAWLKWTHEQTYQRIKVPNVGFVEGWCDVISVSDNLVNFRWTYIFETDGCILSSDSTLRFPKKDEIISSLEQSGYKVKDIRDAPDRPQQELIFIATTS